MKLRALKEMERAGCGAKRRNQNFPIHFFNGESAPADPPERKKKVKAAVFLFCLKSRLPPS